MNIAELGGAWRSVSRTPRHALAAVACIAIGIGATVAVMTLVNAALLRELPYPESDRVVRVWTSVEESNPRSGVAIRNFHDLYEAAESFELLAATARERIIFIGDERAERMRGEAVSADWFAVTGVQPQAGRTFVPEEMPRNGPPAMLISDRLWHNWFGGAPDVIGRTVRVNPDLPGVDDIFYTVIGVMPAGFVGSVEDDVADFWVPLDRFGSEAIHESRRARVLWVLGRLAPGVELADAQRELASISTGLAEAFPDENARTTAWVEPAGENWREGLRGGLYALQVAAALLLVIACVNVANLLFTRLAGRVRELAVRRALGAQRNRVVRQLLTESLVLAATGGLVGLLLAWWIVRAFSAYAAVRTPGWLDLSVDPIVAVSALVLMIATGAAFGVLPAIRGARTPAAAALRAGGRGTLASSRARVGGGALVVLQVALTAMLLTGAGLLARSYQSLADTDLGYRTENVARFAVSVNAADYEGEDALRRFYDELITTLESTPGVVRAGLVFPTVQPWSGFRPMAGRAAADGSEDAVQVHGHAVEPGFFDTMGMTLLSGRMVSAQDSPASERVAVISRSFAEWLIPNGDALDRRFSLGDDEYRVVGVAADVRFDGAIAPTASQWRTERSPDHGIYMSLYQQPRNLVSVAVHTAVDAETMLQPLTRRINALAPRSPVHWVSTMEQELADRYGETRFYMSLLAGFALAAVMLAAVGLYAVLAQTVAARTTEIGLRMALGARRGQVVRKVAASGLALAGIGIAIGVAFSLAGGNAITGLLHGVSPRDPAVLAGVASFLVAVATVAVSLPALRAARIDPMEALRNE